MQVRCIDRGKPERPRQHPASLEPLPIAEPQATLDNHVEFSVIREVPVEKGRGGILRKHDQCSRVIHPLVESWHMMIWCMLEGSSPLRVFHEETGRIILARRRLACMNYTG